MIVNIFQDEMVNLSRFRFSGKHEEEVMHGERLPSVQAVFGVCS